MTSKLKKIKKIEKIFNILIQFKINQIVFRTMLTKSQIKVNNEIDNDLESSQRMFRLLTRRCGLR